MKKRKQQKSKLRKFFRIVLIILLSVLAIAILVPLAINIYVRVSVKSRILTVDEAEKLEGADCIVVLGCSVYGDQPSVMLEDRLNKAIELYKRGCAPKIIMSGDHSGKYYDEVSVMKAYAISKGVPSEDIFKDHYGCSSYDTIYRAKELFGAKKVILVTQKYHLSRCLYIAQKLGIEAYGVATDYKEYKNQFKRDIREYFAIVKDFGMGITKPEVKIEANKISLDQNGDITNELPE